MRLMLISVFGALLAQGALRRMRLLAQGVIGGARAQFSMAEGKP